MADETQRKSYESRDRDPKDGSDSPSSVIDHVHSIAKYNAFSKIDTEEKLELFLKSWWSKLYNRPLKDPVLLSYTLHELLYEYYDRLERERAEIVKREQEADTIEESKAKQGFDDRKWLEQSLAEAKEMYGEDFGKDIDEDFK